MNKILEENEKIKLNHEKQISNLKEKLNNKEKEISDLKEKIMKKREEISNLKEDNKKILEKQRNLEFDIVIRNISESKIAFQKTKEDELKTISFILNDIKANDKTFHMILNCYIEV